MHTLSPVPGCVWQHVHGQLYESAGRRWSSAAFGCALVSAGDCVCSPSPAQRPQISRPLEQRPHILGTDFPILVSEFKFPPRSRICDASHFSFLDSRCKSKDAHGLEIAQFQFLISRFTILVSKRPLHIPNPPVPHFPFLVSGFKGALLSWDLRRAHFSIPISRFSLHRLQRIERR